MLLDGGLIVHSYKDDLMNWDVFVSHASEDKEFAHALAEGLSEKGLRVWFDGFELTVGDSLRRSIDYGLSKSRFGAVILSPSFFAREWTQKELDALTARETKHKKIILPIWHNISVREIRKYSPMLADRLAIDSVMGVDKTVEHLYIKIRSSTPKRTGRRIAPLDEVANELEKIKRSLIVKETELKAVLAQADEIASIDELTSLPNRRRIMADLKDEVRFSERYGTPLSIAIVDIDRFRQINEQHGHLVGDEILVEFASILREPIYFPDTLGRYGGAEFLLIMPHSALYEAGQLAEQLCERIRSTPITYQGHVFHLTISVGITQLNISQEDWSAFFERADKALYKAKESGQNRWVILDS